MDWVAYLAKHGYHGRRATGSEVAYPCFFDCNEPQDSKKRKLYVNADTGMYSCKVCVCEGGSTLLMRHFGDEPEHEETGPTRCVIVNGTEVNLTAGRRREVLEDATAAGERMLSNADDVIAYLLGPRRCLSPETILERRIGYAPAQWLLTDQLPAEKKYGLADKIAAGLVAVGDHGPYEYYRDRVLIPYIQDGRVVQVRGKDIRGRYYTPVGDAVYLYNADALKGATEAVVVEGEFDTMMLADLLATSTSERVRKIAVVGLAGTGALPEDFVQRLAHLRRVFIATDPDEPGRKAADKLHEKLGEKSHIVQWPMALCKQWLADGKPLKDLDWTTWIGRLDAHVDEVAELFKVPGRLKSVMQALVGFRARPTSGLKMGFAGLDNAFIPGLLPGQVVVFLAKTGVGKTVLLCNLAYNMRHQRVMFVTLEMTAEEIWVRLARIYRFYHPFTTDETVAAAYANLRICDANRLDEEALRQLVDEYTEDVGDTPEVCFVDYLGYYAKGRKGSSNYEKTTDAIMQLKAEAKSYQMVVITPSQVNRGAADGKPIDTDDARDSGAIEETADLLVGVWRSDDALDLQSGGMPNGKLHMKILKSRHGNKDKVFLMQMGLMSLVVVDDTATHAVAARAESRAVFHGDTYDEYLTSLRNHQPSLRT